MAEQLEVKELEQVVVRFSGDSGDGMQLAGNIFSTVSATVGNGISTFPDYPADIRAPQGSLTGVSGFQVHIGAGRVYTPGDLCDVLVAMNAAALKTQLKYAKPQATIIIDTDSFGPKDLEKAQFSPRPGRGGRSRHPARRIPDTLTAPARPCRQDPASCAFVASPCRNRRRSFAGGQPRAAPVRRPRRASRRRPRRQGLLGGVVPGAAEDVSSRRVARPGLDRDAVRISRLVRRHPRRSRRRPAASGHRCALNGRATRAFRQSGNSAVWKHKRRRCNFTCCARCRGRYNRAEVCGQWIRAIQVSTNTNQTEKTQ